MKMASGKGDTFVSEHTSTNGRAATRLIQRRQVPHIAPAEANGHGPVNGTGWPQEATPKKWKPRARLAHLEPFGPKEWAEGIKARKAIEEADALVCLHDLLWRRKELTPGEKALLFHSWREAWETGSYWESRASAAEALGLSERQVKDARVGVVSSGTR